MYISPLSLRCGTSYRSGKCCLDRHQHANAHLHHCNCRCRSRRTCVTGGSSRRVTGRGTRHTRLKLMGALWWWRAGMGSAGRRRCAHRPHGSRPSPSRSGRCAPLLAPLIPVPPDPPPPHCTVGDHHVVVSLVSTSVLCPQVAIRLGWGNWPLIDVFTSEGLPAFPFLEKLKAPPSAGGGGAAGAVGGSGAGKARRRRSLAELGEDGAGGGARRSGGSPPFWAAAAAAGEEDESRLMDWWSVERWRRRWVAAAAADRSRRRRR